VRERSIGVTITGFPGGEVAMQKRRQAMRPLVLRALVEHLEESYQMEFPAGADFRETLTDQQVDALVAFKSDERLDSLRRALGRLEEGTFGACLSCKRTIEEYLLRRDPGRQLCGVCEQKLGTVEQFPRSSFSHFSH
jgi:RNA polymerase-binding transcription factor DksA